MSRPTYRRQRAKCPCMNNPDAPSTHRGADHLNEACPHSTLLDTTSRYAEKARQLEARRAAKRERERRRTARPAQRVVL